MGSPASWFTNFNAISTKGDATVGGNLSVAGTVSLTDALTKANLTGAAKRIIVPVAFNGGGALGSSTNYVGWAGVGRAATVTGVYMIAGAAITGGTAALSVLKGSSAGNTQLNAATFDATTLVANTQTSLGLTATTADLALTAAQGVYLKLATGAGISAGSNVIALVEFELNDF